MILDEQALLTLEAGLGLESLGPDMPQGTQEARDYLRRCIQQRLLWVLEHQFARLPQLLYRVDVNEADVDRAFAQVASTPELAEVLAELVLERMLDAVRRRGELDASDESP